MTTINLKDFYYWYTQDQFIEVSDEVAEVFVSDARHEMAYQRRLSRHKAQYSLDCDDGIEYSACLHDQAEFGRKGGAESDRWGKVGYFPDQEHPGK